ncbi:cytochrome P450 [Musa troglodytarum]|uniref:Cytochrome P450 n=1 Tax=Musa troglodytarum TaxID=320322 RepID=A0A9E7KBV1_9LILI|nr:cytochrome P450 [Musa troglodytarum]
MAIAIPFLLSFAFLFLLVSRLLFSSAAVSSSYGPKTHPVIGCLIRFYKNRHRLLDWYTELLEASPTQTIVMRRLGARRTIVTANPENVEHVLKTNFPNYPKGRPFTEILGDLLGCGIFNADGELWHTQRKLASHEFSTRSLCDFVVNALEFETGERLLPILSSACAHRGVVDMQEMLRRFAFDTICKVSLGTDPGFLGASLPESPLADAFEVASAISAKRGAAPVFAVWKAKRALGLGSEGQLRAAVKLIRASVMEILRTRKTDIKKRTQHNDLLSRLIVGGHKDEVIRDMVISFVMAGKDTTSAALTWFFWLLSCHPEAETEVAERLYPPVLWDSKHAAHNDTLPDGTPIKKGDRVTYFPYGMGRSEKLWGKNCMEFDYRRWLSESGEVVPGVPSRAKGLLGEGDGLCSDEVRRGVGAQGVRVEEGGEREAAAGIGAAADRAHGWWATHGGQEEGRNGVHLLSLNAKLNT